MVPLQLAGAIRAHRMSGIELSGRSDRPLPMAQISLSRPSKHRRSTTRENSTAGRHARTTPPTAGHVGLAGGDVAKLARLRPPAKPHVAHPQRGTTGE